MAESPVKLEKVAGGNREREYDVPSYRGLKTAGSVVVTIIGITFAVLTAYYTAEATQSATIADNAERTAVQQQRLAGNENALRSTLSLFNETLKNQRKSLDEITKAVIRLDTRQEVLIERVEKLDQRLNVTRRDP